MIQESQYNMIKQAIDRGITFAAVREPDCDSFTLYSKHGDGDKQLYINIFNTEFPNESIVLAETIDFSGTEFTDFSVSPLQATNKEEYLRNISELTTQLRKNEKCVIARVTDVHSNKNPLEVACTYFNSLHNTFQAIYYTPFTGLWITATPELLLNFNIEKKTYKSMALAGTRQISDGEWDEKNIHEHDFVTRHILCTFKSFDLSTKVSEPQLLKFGNIEHLMHTITGEGEANVTQLFNVLNPTPAVCGYPVNKAISLINRYEDFKRSCYAGTLTIVSPTQLTAFVNLRCARVDVNNDNYTYHIITGGGITHASIPEDEWHETTLKAAPLINSIKS